MGDDSGTSTSGHGGAGASAQASFEQAHGELLADRSIQFELTPADQPRPPVRESQGQPPPMSPPIPAGGVVTSLFWIVLALAALGLIALIVARMTGWLSGDRSRPPTASEPDWRPEDSAARGLLGDADALAAAGRYFEAAHLLLHRSIADIEERRPATVRKALTSRDIAGLPSLPPSPAAAFAAIVRAVERSLFGGRPLDESAWRDCRAAYQRFAFASEWQR